MARGVKALSKKKAAAKLPKVASGELVTLLDFVRYAVSRFSEAELTFAHGTTDPVAEAAFLVCEALTDIRPDRPFYPARGIKGMTRASHAFALGLGGAAGLARLCDRANAEGESALWRQADSVRHL